MQKTKVKDKRSTANGNRPKATAKVKRQTARGATGHAPEAGTPGEGCRGGRREEREDGGGGRRRSGKDEKPVSPDAGHGDATPSFSFASSFSSSPSISASVQTQQETGEEHKHH